MTGRPVPGVPVTSERRGAALWIRIERANKLNVLDASVLHGIAAALADVEEDPDIFAVVLTGAGDRAFCAGADLRAIKAMAAHEFAEANLLGHEVFEQIRRTHVPVVAAINGIAYGGGLELALACDVRLAVHDASLALPEVQVGVLPGWGGTWRLAEVVGAGRARELILTGRRLDSAEALRIGLISRVADDQSDLRRQVGALVGQFAQNSRAAMRYAKALLNGDGYRSHAETGMVGALMSTREFGDRTRRF